MTMELNKIVTEPSMKDLLDVFKKDIFLSLNCHAIGTIKSFDPETQTVTATINYKKTYFERAQNGVYSPVLFDYPILIDCPVIIMQGGDGSLTFPISDGDTCLILFNDRDMDNWFSSGQIGPVATQRLHSFSDGIALIGLRAMNNPIENYDPDRVVLSKGTTKIGLGTTLIQFQNATTSLLQVINGLIDLLSTSFTTPTQTPGNPLNAGASTALTAYKLIVEGLLE